MCKIRINWRKLYQNVKTNKNISVDHLKSSEASAIYKENLKFGLKSLEYSSNQDHWTKLSNLCIQNSELLKPKKKTNHQNYNSQIEELSHQQKVIKLQQENCGNRQKYKILQKERNSKLKEIHQITKEEKENKLLEGLEEIENSKDDSRRMFQAIKYINRKTNSNIIVKNKEGEIAGTTTKKIEQITDFFSKLFKVKM